MQPDMNELFKQAQKMQQDMKDVQDRLATLTVEGSAGGGMVKVTANCQNRIVSIDIEAEVVDPEEKEMLEDLIAAAVNQALQNASTRSQEEMQKAMGPLGNLTGGGFKLPGL